MRIPSSPVRVRERKHTSMEKEKKKEIEIKREGKVEKGNDVVR